MTLVASPSAIVARRAVIVARNASARERLWGMTLVERLLRQLSEVGVSHAVVLHPAAWGTEPSLLRADFADWTEIEVELRPVEGEGELDAVAAALDPEGCPTIVLDAHIVIDTRILRHLATSEEAVRFVEEDLPADSALVMAVTPDLWEVRHDASTGPKTLSAEDLDAYLQKTRKHVRPSVLAVHGARDLHRAARETFGAVYKGATDFITKWVFYHPARWIVGWVSPTAITPNQITALSMVISFGAIVPFFMGEYRLAVVMGLVMALLDTVDGKLARTTLRTSTSGDLLDHVSDTAYLLLWYVGLGWSLTGGRLFDLSDPSARAHAVLLLAFVADKILTGLYKRIHGFELHDYTRIDYVARIFIARRNPFLVGMIIALALGRPALGLQIIAAWYVATFAFHLSRFIYLPLAGVPHQSQNA
ncbi:MAG: CDP-alcohol phosphatidyltransferase family protein [Longimicrobiales bacterium]|nr:CDP-alcohol phosphatidyltransferase family protein [Longimicrobiales bacterium]